MLHPEAAFNAASLRPESASPNDKSLGSPANATVVLSDRSLCMQPFSVVVFNAKTTGIVGKIHFISL